MEFPHSEPTRFEDREGLTRRQFLGVALCLGAGGALSSCAAETEPSPIQPELPDCSDVSLHVERTALTDKEISLVEYDWHMPGMEKNGDRLHVSLSPITVMEKNGTDQATLALWPDRRFDADTLHITSSLRLDSSDTNASLLLAAELPATYDDFQFPGKGVRVSVTDRTCTLEVWDGIHKDPTAESFVLATRDLRKKVEIVKKEGKLKVAIDGQPIKELAQFTEKCSWVGLEASAGDFVVDKLHVNSSDKSASVVDMTTLKVQDCDEGLRDSISRKSCTIGAALAVTPLLENAKLAAIAAGNFSLLTTENSLKPQFVHPQEGVYAFEETERLVAFAANHNMQVHGHALLPNRSMPKWMRELPTETTVDKARVKQVMVDHITKIVEHFPSIQSFDVVNEALDGEEWRKETVWYRAMGDEFINIAFAAAHKANPNAMLFINDYALDKAGDYDENRFQMLLAKMQEVLRENPSARIGIGFEGHVYETPRDCMSPGDLRRRMKDLGNNRMVGRVSEMDVTTHHKDSSTTTDEGLKLQAQQFGDIAKVCMESPACVSFTMWGIGGKYVSTAGVNESGELTWGSNLPWDKDLKQRPLTYKALQEAISS